MAKSYDEWLQEQRKKTLADADNKIINYNSTIDKQVAAQNKIVDDAINFTTGQYDTKIGETKQDYEELYDVNEVQKKINERNVAERMASLGLTDSGLNRTQQTAIQLSHGNARTNLSISEQKAVDTLKNELAARIADYTAQKQANLADAEANKSQYAIAAREAAENNAAANATSLYNQQVEAEAALEKARIEAAAKAAAAKTEAAKKANITYKYIGKKDDNTMLFLGSDGEKYQFGIGYNPNADQHSTDYYEAIGEIYGYFSNGYQPKGINGYGKVYALGYEDENTGSMIYRTEPGVNTREGGRRFWIWSEKDNRYIDITTQAKNDPTLSKLF